VLRASGNIDDDRFRIAADVNPVDFALACTGEPIERGTDGNGHGAGASDACASGSFGISSERETGGRLEEFYDFGEKRELVTLGVNESGERAKGLFAFGIARDQADAFVAVGFDDAGSVARDCGVDGERAGMEEIKRPDVESAAGQVHASGSF